MTERTELPQLATRAEAADALHVSIRTVDRLIGSGRLVEVRPSTRAVRVTWASIRALAAPTQPSSTDSTSVPSDVGAASPSAARSGAPEAPPSAPAPKAGAPDSLVSGAR